MNCPNCGSTVPPGVGRCRKCGSFVEQAAQSSAPATTQPIIIQTTQVPVKPEAARPQPKSKIAAGVLGIVFGALGVHRFYLGYNGIGFAQLMLTLTPSVWRSLHLVGYTSSWNPINLCPYIAGIWGVIDGIYILTGKISKDAKGEPLQ